tara:strand:+ start:311 stop:601 length:291 start_codon:yes stop_codon:yes gene_type:complete
MSARYTWTSEGSIAGLKTLRPLHTQWRRVKVYMWKQGALHRETLEESKHRCHRASVMFSIYLDDDYGVVRVVAADRLLSTEVQDRDNISRPVLSQR